MTVLPITGRELRVKSRKAGTYWGRVSAGAAFIVLCALFLLETNLRSSPARLGKELFAVLGAVSLIGAVLGGALSVADAVSSEKRDGTLGLLFLTDLKGRDILWGKLAAHGMDSLFQLLAALPVLALPILLGGVTLEQFSRMALLVLNSLFLALAAGLFTSTISRSARKSMVGVVLLLAFLSIGTIALEGLAHELAGVNYHEPYVARVSPVAGFVAVVDPRSFPSGNNQAFWHCILLDHLLAWLFLTLAGTIVPRVWQERAMTVRTLRWRERLQRWSTGVASERAAYRTRMLERNPVCWLDDRYRLQKTFLWGSLLAITVLWMWMWTITRNPEYWLKDDVVFPTMVMVHHALLIWVAFAATHRFSDDKRSGALELLLSTPIDPRRIVRGRLLALWRQFGWAIIAVMVADAFMMGGVISLLRHGMWWWRMGYDVFLALTAAAGILMLPLHALALSYTGLWFSLKLRNGTLAALMNLIVVVGMHWAVFMAAIIAGAILDHYGVISGFEEEHALAFWFGFGGVNSLFWIWRCRRKLARDFRLAACPTTGKGGL